MPGSKLYRSIALSTLVGLLAACSSTQEQSTDTASATESFPDPLSETSWEVTSIYGSSADKVTATLQFAEESRVGGTTGCNNFSGQVTRNGTSMDFGMLATTRKMCTPALNGQERAYLEALDTVNGWRRTGGQLDLTDAEGQVVISLRESGS